jgi:hypothetical protein
VVVVSFISTITPPNGGLCKAQTAVFIYQPKFRAKNGVSTIEKQGVDKPSFARK